jgi:hypothetical protein
MLAYIPLLQWHPEDGTSVPKHAGVHIFHKWCTKGCRFWMIYWCKNLTYISCLYSVCVHVHAYCVHTHAYVHTPTHTHTHPHTHTKSQIQLAHKFIRMCGKCCFPIKWWGGGKQYSIQVQEPWQNYEPLDWEGWSNYVGLRNHNLISLMCSLAIH